MKSLFALQLFDGDNPIQVKSFAVTIASVAVGTYLFSGLLIWCTRQPSRWETPANALSRVEIRATVKWVQRMLLGGLERMNGRDQWLP